MDLVLLVVLVAREAVSAKDEPASFPILPEHMSIYH